MMLNLQNSDLGKLSEPATELIKKVSEGVVGLARPWQIVRVAKAEAKAAEIASETAINITEKEYRCFQALVAEEELKRENISKMTYKAIPFLDSVNSHPENIENDWIANFYDKGKLISDDEIQDIWAKILAGEANNPGSYSKRTINILASLNKSDALLFQQFCNFSWQILGNRLLIYDLNDSIYTSQNVNISRVIYLTEIGLINHREQSSLGLSIGRKGITVAYFDKLVNLEFPLEENNILNFGQVLFSQSGLELSKVCATKPVPGFFEYVINRWINVEGIKVYTV